MKLLFLLLISQVLAAQAVYSEISENLLKEALEKQHNTSIDIIKFEVQNATEKGDNHLSVLFRVDVQYHLNGSTSLSNTSVIVKTQIMDDGTLKNKTALLFPEEVEMYSKILKEMNEVLTEANRVSPKAYSYQTEEPMMIVMEDLSLEGYAMERCRKAFDLEHSLLVMDVIARFHAASACLYGNELAADYQPSNLSSIFNTTVETFEMNTADGIKNFPAVPPKYVKKLVKNGSRFRPLLKETMQYKKSKFNVLNHGDLYANNLMFKHNSTNQPIDALLIDFQLNIYTSPAYDLVTIMSLGISDQVYFNDREKLVERYYRTLKATMEQIPCKTKVLSLEELRRDIADFTILDMLDTLNTLPYILDNQKCQLHEQFIHSTVKEKSANATLDELREIFTKRFALYDQMGLLDLK